jgi:hypothetical protein
VETHVVAVLCRSYGAEAPAHEDLAMQSASFAIPAPRKLASIKKNGVSPVSAFYASGVNNAANLAVLSASPAKGKLSNGSSITARAFFMSCKPGFSGTEIVSPDVIAGNNPVSAY